MQAHIFLETKDKNGKIKEWIFAEWEYLPEESDFKNATDLEWFLLEDKDFNKYREDDNIVEIKVTYETDKGNKITTTFI